MRPALGRNHGKGSEHRRKEAVAAIEPVKVALCVRAHLAGIKRSDLIAKVLEARAKEQIPTKALKPPLSAR
ncbi:MAG: hypothetical protein IPL86_15810 [Flavobacteriales bacterium]|nr:hypothetical protein [Flavobacteriales bacterium]